MTARPLRTRRWPRTGHAIPCAVDSDDERGARMQLIGDDAECARLVHGGDHVCHPRRDLRDLVLLRGFPRRARPAFRLEPLAGRRCLLVPGPRPWRAWARSSAGWRAAFGPRRLFLAGGLVMGTGLDAHRRDDRSGGTCTWRSAGLTAVGISLAGWVAGRHPGPRLVPRAASAPPWVLRRPASASGILALIPLAQILIDRWGWRWAFRVEALLTVGLADCRPTRWLIRDPPGFEPRAGSGRTTDRVSNATHPGPWRPPREPGDSGAWRRSTSRGISPPRCSWSTRSPTWWIMGVSADGRRRRRRRRRAWPASAAKVGWGVLSDRAGRELACTLAFGCVAASHCGTLVLAGQLPGVR
ncbi:MAG: hypothetical protein MZV70_63830 [Desulfobacterales bacterium]|nr:hypothetical protein [Desulfobacterales bacterium]